MRGTFQVLFCTKNQAVKNGRISVMECITVNGTTASFSCKVMFPLCFGMPGANPGRQNI